MSMCLSQTGLLMVLAWVTLLKSAQLPIEVRKFFFLNPQAPEGKHIDLLVSNWPVDGSSMGQTI